MNYLCPYPQTVLLQNVPRFALSEAVGTTATQERVMSYREKTILIAGAIIVLAMLLGRLVVGGVISREFGDVALLVVQVVGGVILFRRFMNE